MLLFVSCPFSFIKILFLMIRLYSYKYFLGLLFGLNFRPFCFGFFCWIWDFTKFSSSMFYFLLFSMSGDLDVATLPNSSSLPPFFCFSFPFLLPTIRLRFFDRICYFYFLYLDSDIYLNVLGTLTQASKRPTGFFLPLKSRNKRPVFMMVY